MVRLEHAFMQAGSDAEPKRDGEPYINEDVVGVEARLLADGDFLQSDYPSGNGASRFQTGDADNYTHTLSRTKQTGYEERLSYYSRHHPNATFDQRMSVWRNSFSGFVNRKKTSLSGDEQVQWITFCNGMGIAISASDDATDAHAQTFFNRYFRKEQTRLGQDWVVKEAEFLMDGLNLYKDGDLILHRKPGAIIDIRREWLEELGRYSLGDVSGKIISFLIDGRAAIMDPQAQPLFIDAANRKMNALSQSDKRLLDDFGYLSGKAEGRQATTRLPLLSVPVREPPTPVSQNEVSLSPSESLKEQGMWRKENPPIVLQTLIKLLRDTYGISEDLFPADLKLANVRVFSAAQGEYVDLAEFIQKYGQSALLVQGQLPALWLTIPINYKDVIIKPTEAEVRKALPIVKNNNLVPKIHVRNNLVTELRRSNPGFQEAVKELAVGLASYLPDVDVAQVEKKTYIFTK